MPGREDHASYDVWLAEACSISHQLVATVGLARALERPLSATTHGSYRHELPKLRSGLQVPVVTPVTLKRSENLGRELTE